MPPEPDFLHIKLGGSPDPKFLRKVLIAHFKHQRLQAGRRFFIGVLALLGGGLWLVTRWPGLVAPRVRSLGLELWALCLIVTLTLGVREGIWRRRRDRLMRANLMPDHDRKPSP
jgi:hypothetical protein